MRAITFLVFILTLPALMAVRPEAAAPLAQAAQPPANPAPAPSPAAAPTSPAVPENYAYQPDGRRDPFMSLVGAGVGAESRIGAPADGAAGIAVADLSVRGVLESRGSLTAMVQGPDNRTYVVHPGDKLADGVIKAVTMQGLVIVQEVNDPLSLVKQREVTKRLRSLEDAKQ